MDLSRKIGNNEILVDINSEKNIYLSKKLLQKYKYSIFDLTQTEICKILSDNSYFPLYLQWEIIDKCNFSCPFCYINEYDNKKSAIEFAKVKKKLNYLIDKGLLFCLLTGGEPLLHPDFIPIYKHLKKKGVFVEIYTNASLITREVIDLFKQYKPFKVEVSIYGIDRGIFNKNTLSNLDPELILNNILLLKSNGINVKCKTALNKMTIKEFKLINQWCNKHDIAYYYSTEVVNSYSGKNMQKYAIPKSVRASLDSRRISKQEIFNYKNKETKKCFECSAGKYGIYINSDFELKPCSGIHLPIFKYNLLQENIEKSVKNLEDRISNFIHMKIEGCIENCKAKILCKMCPAIANIIRSKDGKIIGYAVPEEYCQSIFEQFELLVENL